MNRFLSGLMATTLAASFAFAAALPLNAAPIFVPKSHEVRTDAETVNHTRRHWRYQQRRWAERRAERHWRRHHSRFYHDDYYYERRQAFRHHHRHYRPWRDGGVTLEFSF